MNALLHHAAAKPCASGTIPPRVTRRVFAFQRMNADGTAAGWEKDLESKSAARAHIKGAARRGKPLRPYCVSVDLASGQSRIRPVPGWREPYQVGQIALKGDPMLWTAHVVRVEESIDDEDEELVLVNLAGIASSPRDAWAWLYRFEEDREPDEVAVILLGPGERLVSFDNLALWPQTWQVWTAEEGGAVPFMRSPFFAAGDVRRATRNAYRDGEQVVVVSPFEGGSNE